MKGSITTARTTQRLVCTDISDTRCQWENITLAFAPRDLERILSSEKSCQLRFRSANSGVWEPQDDAGTS